MRIYYDINARNIVIEGSERFFGSGSLEAVADGNDVFVRYKEATAKEIQVPFNQILKENGTLAGATVTAVVGYLNDEFSKGIIMGQSAFSLLSVSTTVVDSRVRAGNKILVQPIGTVNEVLGVSSVTNGAFTVTRTVIAVLSGFTNNLTFEWVRL